MWDATVLLRAGRSADLDGLADVADLAAGFLRRAGIDQGDGLRELARVWPLVRLPGGAAGWAWAVRMAKSKPVRVAPSPGIGRRPLTAALAYYLSQHSGGGPFVLPGEKVAAAFGLPRATAFEHVGDLADRGVIHWHDPTWDQAEGRARLAVFVGIVAGPAAHRKRPPRRPPTP